MVSSKYYKEYSLMKTLESDHTGFIADCTFSSVTISSSLLTIRL